VATDQARVAAAWAIIRWIPGTTVKRDFDGVAQEGGIGAAAAFVCVAVVDELPCDADAGLIGEATWATWAGIDNHRLLAAFATDHEQAIVG
jgi:hypothetical protein